MSFEILAHRAGELNAKIEKFNRRAEKLGRPLITTRVVGHIAAKYDDCGRVERRACIVVEIEGERPKIPGHRMIATIDHSKAGNVIRAADKSVEVPAKYRTVAAWCDHCQKTRKRRDSYLLLSDSGDWKQVGRACLGDFCDRKTVEAIASRFEFEASLRSLAEEGVAA